MSDSHHNPAPAVRPPISIVIPVYNEIETLPHLRGALVDGLEPEGVDFEVVLVNDGSSDGSAEYLDGMAREDLRFKVVHFVRNYGQTAAMSAGLRHATRDVLVTMDADLQNDPADIPMMLDRLAEGYDLVCGWRKSRKDGLVLRKIPSWAANWLISRLSKVHLHDYGCTLKVYKREYVHDIPLYGQMHRFIPIYVTWAGARMLEVPVRHHPRRYGTSKYGLGRVFRVLLDMLTVKFLRDYFVNPLYFFGYFAAVAVSLGLLFPILGILAKLLYPEWPHNVLLGIAATFFVMVGFQAALMGLIAEVLIRMNFEIQGKAPYRVARRTAGLGRGDQPLPRAVAEFYDELPRPGEAVSRPEQLQAALQAARAHREAWERAMADVESLRGQATAPRPGTPPPSEAN